MTVLLFESVKHYLAMFCDMFARYAICDKTVIDKNVAFPMDVFYD